MSGEHPCRLYCSTASSPWWLRKVSSPSPKASEDEDDDGDFDDDDEDEDASLPSDDEMAS